MKYSTQLFSALAISASLFSFTNTAFAGPGPRALKVTNLSITDEIALEAPRSHVGEVMCNVNTSPAYYNGNMYPAGSLVRERHFVDYIQVGQTYMHEVIDDGFGTGKALSLVLMDCQANAHLMCEYAQSPLPPHNEVDISSVRISGNLFNPAVNFNCN